MDTKEVGAKLVELCKQGKNLEAIETFYDHGIVSVEAQAAAGMPAVMTGIDAIRGKHKWWVENHEIHSSSAEGPFANGDRFAVIYQFDVTPKDGPMKGKRMAMKEIGVYTVKDGKIVREEFLY